MTVSPDHVPEAQPRVRRKVRVTAGILFGFLWLLVLFAMAEGYVRFRFYWESQRNALIYEERGRRVEKLAALDMDFWDVPFVSYKKNVEFEADLGGRPFQIRMNNFGYRGQDPILPKPEGTYRITCLGGSTTVEGHTDETTYPARLGHHLREQMNEAGIESFNCGVSGITATGELRGLPELLSMDPDLIVEYNCINDLNRIVELFVRRSSGWRKAVWKSEFLSRLLQSWLKPTPEWFATRLENGILRQLRAIEEQARSRGVEVVFCSFAKPDLEQLRPEERSYLEYMNALDWKGSYISPQRYAGWIDLYNARLKQMCADLGILYIPVAEEMSGGMENFNDFCHMTDLGIDRKAKIIASHLGPYIKDRLPVR